MMLISSFRGSTPDNQGDYEGALSYFMNSVAEVPAFEGVRRTIRKCVIHLLHCL